MLRKPGIRNGLFTLTILAACSLTSGAADLVNLSVEIDGWTMMPIAENGATTHIIAARNDDEALTTDIDVVLYEKTTDGWAGSAYAPSVTKEDAILDLADEFALPDPFSGEWHIDLDAEDVLDHVLPRVGFGKGFFVTDPLYLIAHQMNDPEPLAEGAEDSGLPAGSSSINTGSISGGTPIGDPQPVDGCGCENACIQDSIAAGVDASLTDPSLDLDTIELLAFTESQNLLACCVPWTWTANTPPPGNWFCGPGSSWSLDSQSVHGCTYRRTATRIVTRVRVKRCLNCTRHTWTQICIQTGDIIHTTLRDTNGACVPPPSSTCGTPTDNFQNGSWTPPGPPC